MAFEYTIDDDGNLTIIEFTVQPAEVHRVDNDDASDYSEEEEESGDDDASDYSEGRNNNLADKSVHIWDSRKFEKVQYGQLHRHRQLVTGLRSDALRCVSCSLDGSIKVSSLIRGEGPSIQKSASREFDFILKSESEE
uniref:Uncharacterized protein n=1 Tax=Chromera velia CCMP2878 TaxID=1169474 RepID=A0A0G4F7A1_9ALVE|eukprot:Cvel_2926.t1-p1 / transcript=Cvel_2926.t1 / gene=Cvel_2926 / organism=Chromera_velia_CCMP2878 / gene_product=hypothetical protein / transcript_product=hypothetical protein / location=Cvel_scaffold115:110500-115579(-) / protein_length=137 / sequence_SO=supercontig / SO=protein_coding / is_pseudo=false